MLLLFARSEEVHVSHGRLELGVGKGITAFEHLQFGHPPGEAGARSDDILTMLLEAWETGIISSEGSAFYDFLELQLPFKPVQHPYPPLWTAGNVETAGRGGHNFIFPAPRVGLLPGGAHESAWDHSAAPPAGAARAGQSARPGDAERRSS